MGDVSASPILIWGGIMPKTAVFNMRMDPETKKEAEELFASFGLNMADAVNIFIHQALMEEGFPFEIRKKAAKKEDTPNE